MHHPRSALEILRFRLAAFLLFGNYLLAFLIVGLMGRSLLTDNFGLTLIGSALVIFLFVLLGIQWTVASRAGCPLCRTPVLAPKSCTKHRLARTFLGSHRLKVALSVLFNNRFQCPYCNEPTALQLGKRVHLAHSRRSLKD
jgi:hypothetical protein